MPRDPKPFLLGLTGSIGMGKSTTAAMFAQAGVPVWDGDAAVHRLYGPKGAAVSLVAALCPEANIDGAINRDVLKKWIARIPDALIRLEQVVHPLVAADRANFVAKTRADILVFDIPLLLETGADAWLDAVAVVSTDPQTQTTRVMARPGVTRALFDSILAKQMPDPEKRARADYLIATDTLASAEAAVDAVLCDIRGKVNA